MPITDSKARGRELLSAGDEVAGGVIDENVEGSGFPDCINHGFDGVEIADIAGEGMDRAVGGVGEFCGSFLENFFAASADVDRGAELEKAVGHGFAEAGAAAGDQDALVVQEVVAEHLCSPNSGR